MEERLSEAAIAGSLDELDKIITDDNFILDKVVVGCLSKSPLHTAASYGHTKFVKELLKRKPKLAQVLDSTNRTALHLASAEGHLEVVRELIKAWPDMCLVRDREGKNALHVAAMNGRVNVLEELVRMRPHAARVRLEGDESILHLCIKHHRIEALKKLLDLINDEEFVQAKDSDGNTIFHLAVIGKQLEIINYMIDEKKIKAINATNASGRTALDILVAKEQDSNIDKIEAEIEAHLQKANAKGARSLEEGEWVYKNKDALMVVASLIATIAFQVGVNPPGGVWQDNSDGHRAGEAVMAYNYPDSYPLFIRLSTIGFITSLSTILLLNSGLHMKRRTYTWLLMVVMWLAITSTAACFAVGIVWVTPKMDRESLTRTVVAAVTVFCSVMSILLIVHIGRLVRNIICEKWIIYRALENIKADNISRWKATTWVPTFVSRITPHGGGGQLSRRPNPINGCQVNV